MTVSMTASMTVSVQRIVESHSTNELQFVRLMLVHPLLNITNDLIFGQSCVIRLEILILYFVVESCFLAFTSNRKL